LSPWLRQIFAALVFGWILLMAGPAAAWVEQNPKSLLSLVEVEKDGSATISHELVLELRGGPLKSIDLVTADADAEVLPDATVTRAAGGPPIPLLVERRADGSLGLEVDLPKGLRSGTWLFKVRYRTNLLAGGRLKQRAGGLELAWVGPRLESGVDGVRAIFRLPASNNPPRLPPVDKDDAETSFGVMVSGVHHTPSGDEIELVRSHVARGEPVLWRIEADANAVAIPALPQNGPAEATPAAQIASGAAPARPGSRWPLICAGFGAALALLTALKERELRRATAGLRTVLAPLVPVPLWCRAPLAGSLLAGALISAHELEQPVLAALGVVLAAVLAVSRAPRLERTPRGPGRWLSLRDDDAFAARRERSARLYFDSGTLLGALVLALVLAAVAALAASELARSPYRAALVAFGGAAFVPVFFVGRLSELVHDRAGFSRRFMRSFARIVRERTSAKAVAWGRVPDGQSEPDELRVLVQPKDALTGLVALETGLDAQRGLGGVVGVPFVIVRAKEGSPAQSALPRGVIWTRGRKPDERVAILSPKLPTVGLTVALVEKLLAALSAQAPSKRRMSRGNPAFTSKLGTVRSPAHAA
jgi:hypothetical protein